MADTPGRLLLRSGVLQPPQVAAATARRQREGGSFGENLVQLGYIDEESLAEFYHTRLLIARASELELGRVPSEVLALVSGDMAAEFRVLPLAIEPDGSLLLVMADPSDNHAVDEVAFFADRFVVRVVATEGAVRRAIERHYGLRIDAPVAREPARPAPTLRPVEDPPPREPAPREPPPPRDEQPVLLTKVKYSDTTPLPQPLPPPPEGHEPALVEVDIDVDEEPILLTRPVALGERPKRDTLPGFAQITVPDPPLAALRAAHSREAVAASLLDYVQLLMRRAALFVMKKPILVGLDARGEDLDAALVKQLVINVEAPGIFRDVIASRLPYRGPLPETPANRAFAYAIGGVAAEVLLMPVAVRDRVIAVLFADGAAQPLPDAALHATVREAGLAYERLILEAKTSR